MENAINWFEIFVTDLNRATRFYEEILGIKMRREELPGMSMSIFAYKEPAAVGGALVRADDNRKPGAGGTLVYLNTGGKLDAALAKVERAGGAVVMPRTEIGDPGAIAIVRDPDGNLVGLHQERQ